jgi:hypothetical protein
MSTHPKNSILAYGISCLLDAADGHAARALGQTSKFGAVLDMVVDRYDNDPTVVDSMSDRRPETVARHPVYSAI